MDLIIFFVSRNISNDDCMVSLCSFILTTTYCIKMMLCHFRVFFHLCVCYCFGVSQSFVTVKLINVLVCIYIYIYIDCV